MNLLIVADEYYSAKSTMAKIQRDFGDQLDEIHCAYSMESALQCVDEHPIDILICDIEMPGGSGLDLLTAIRTRGLSTICIFLTAYARFDYVSSALRLSSIDYLLKPVADDALRTSVQKAIDEYHNRSSLAKKNEDAEHWKVNKARIVELFWADLARGLIRADSGQILEELKLRGLNTRIAEQKLYPLVMQCLFRHSKIIQPNLYDFILRNILQEYFFLPAELPSVIQMGDGYYFLPLPEERWTKSELVEKCRSAYHDFIPQLPDRFNFFIPREAISLPEVERTIKDTLDFARQNVSLENHIFDMSRDVASNKDTSEMTPYFQHWISLLQQKKEEELTSDVSLYLNHLQISGEASRLTLRTFYQGFLTIALQQLSTIFPASLSMFRTQIYSYTETQVIESFYTLREWTMDVIHTYFECLADSPDEIRSVRTVKEYIHGHLSEDLSREQLAGLVHLTPDYLSHLFKKKTGLSLTNYIIHERIEAAKLMLLKTDHSISEIAKDCGFQNISYFSKQFRTFTGMTPREYRK